MLRSENGVAEFGIEIDGSFRTKMRQALTDVLSGSEEAVAIGAKLPCGGTTTLAEAFEISALAAALQCAKPAEQYASTMSRMVYNLGQATTAHRLLTTFPPSRVPHISHSRMVQQTAAVQREHNEDVKVKALLARAAAASALAAAQADSVQATQNSKPISCPKCHTVSGIMRALLCQRSADEGMHTKLMCPNPECNHAWTLQG